MNSNILHVTHSVCLAMQGKKEESKQALSNFRLLDVQYAKDYVTVAYLLAKVLVSDLHDEESEEIMRSYSKRKPSPKWWGIDLIYLGITMVIPSGTSAGLFAMCKEHLLRNNILSENGLDEIHSSPKDHDKTALEKFLSFLNFPS